MQHGPALQTIFNFKLAARLLTLFALSAILIIPSSDAFAKKSSHNPRYASIVMDADTGVILHQRYADKKLHPASLTKVMTLMMVFEALDRGTLRLNDRIYISKHAASMVPSKIGLPAGSSIRVQDAIYALVTKSANDIAVAVAERLGRSERNFASLMTRRARDFGMHSTTFRNASGLHDPRQITTARDMSKLARIVIQDYPEYYRYFSRQNFTYKGKTYKNHNKLLGTYKGMDGMKTGYIRASGFNLVASAVRNNRRLIGVVFGGRSGKSRNAHMAKLLDNGFGKVHTIRVASAKAPLPPRKPGLIVALNNITKAVPPRTGVSAGSVTRVIEQGSFDGIIGQGANDPAATSRIETGLMAIAAHRGDSPKQRPVLASYVPTAPASWAIQIGAFNSRMATDRALRSTIKELPRKYASARPVIAPLKTADGWLFRGRLSGYTRAEAFKACGHIKDCMPVAPQNN